MLAGALGSSFASISATAASRGTDGWQTPRVWTAGSEVIEHGAQIVDVIVEIERPDSERDHARVRPVGDVDVAMRQERFDRAAQERGVMAGHGRDDQQFRLLVRAGKFRADKAQEIAERPAPDDVLEDRMDDAVDFDLVEPEGRLAVAARHALEKLGARRNVPAHRRAGQRVPGIAENEMGCVRNCARRSERYMGHFVELIRITLEHRGLPILGVEGQSSLGG